MAFHIIDINACHSQRYLRNFRRNAAFNENVNQIPMMFLGRVGRKKTQIVQMMLRI